MDRGPTNTGTAVRSREQRYGHANSGAVTWTAVQLYRRTPSDLVWNGVVTLRIEFSDGSIAAESTAESVVVTIGGTTHELSRDAANDLAEAIGEAMVSREEFLRTAGEHRADGAYVVSRRAADSAGNEKVFESFDRLRRLYDRLPEDFGADEVGRTGITGSRRHMLVRHFAEHPAFDCRTTSRNPLQVRKETGASSTAEGTSEGAIAD